MIDKDVIEADDEGRIIRFEIPDREYDDLVEDVVDAVEGITGADVDVLERSSSRKSMSLPGGVIHSEYVKNSGLAEFNFSIVSKHIYNAILTQIEDTNTNKPNNQGVQNGRGTSTRGNRGHSSPKRKNNVGTEHAVAVSRDGTTKFKPEFDKTAAEYIPEGRNDTGYKCEDCAHFIEGGGCHLVQGSINPEAMCESFYADFGVFMRDNNGKANINLKLWGESFDENVSPEQMSNFIKHLRKSMNTRK